MQIEIGTDHSVKMHDEWTAKLEAMVQHAMRHHREQLTRVVLHLSDQNADKSGDADKRCAMEGRLRGMQPVAVTHSASTFDQAVSGAADKLARLLENTLAKASAKRPPPPPVID